MPYTPENPLIVQSDRSLLLEVNNPRYESARDALARFAELVKSPEFIHTYQITPLSLWNAAAAGEPAEVIIGHLHAFAKFDLPPNIVADIHDYMGRYGRLKLQRRPDKSLVLTSDDAPLIAQVWHNKACRAFLVAQLDANTLLVDPAARGHIKQALVQLGFPAEDLAGYVEGSQLPLAMRDITVGGRSFDLRHYQREAVDIFYEAGSSRGGSGVIVLPCGAGKTVVGIATIAELACHTLILCPNTVAVRQWITELLDKTDLTPDQIGEYTGEKKEIRPVTLATYQIMSYRHGRHRANGDEGEGVPAPLSEQDFPHLGLFQERDWGLIIYDEVHLLPAPVFRITAEIQARRRLGLTATLVREDGRESDVFSLIGPKKYDVPWRDLERQGWIAEAICTEVRLNLPTELRMDYALAEDSRVQYRIAAENPGKMELLDSLLRRHQHDNVLIIGQYIEQLTKIADRTGAPLITGKTKTAERERLYDAFRRGEEKLLVVSKVANFAIDLPDANVAIQVSGTYGSRQEEAQRLGRVLRPKGDGRPAHFYTLVTRDTRDQDFAANRQLFLTEQGYRYLIQDATEVLNG
ncbi:MAG: DEAD/DEAH box helicase [Chloroflexaceae bacterium]|jgi:DNA excision repair protein ERCC-3|nr:DEAD/DEAH box helicase [Chloroflexaceae bacterium]